MPPPARGCPEGAGVTVISASLFISDWELSLLFYEVEEFVAGALVT